MMDAVKGIRHRGTSLGTAAAVLVLSACRADGREQDVRARAAEHGGAPVHGPPSGPSLPAPAAEPAASLPVLPDFTDAAWTRVPSRGGKYLVCWRSLAGRVPRNEDFELEVWVLRDGMPVRGAYLGVSAWMPDHGHGMLRQPRAEEREDGSYRIAGMLLHMRGRWQLFFEVLEGTLSETAECALDL
jgi:hypothetical protein